MKNLILILLSANIFLLACGKETEVDRIIEDEIETISRKIPDTVVNVNDLHFDRNTSIWSLNEKAYSGYVFSLHDDSINYKEKFSLLDGKKQNHDTIWYENGLLKQVASYQNGKLHGEKKYWLFDSSHMLISQLNYLNGKANGEQMIWYPSGELHKKLNLIQGQEVGIQKAYRQNGALYVNYEAKNGRIFGLKKASLCFGLEDQKLTFN